MLVEVFMRSVNMSVPRFRRRSESGTRSHFMSEVGFTPSQSEELLEENDRFRAEACVEAPWNQN